MSDSQVSVGAALGYALSLWRSHWREIWGALALNALACTVFFAGMFTGADEITAAGIGGLLVTTFPVYGAIMRLALAADHPGDPDFQLGALGLQWRRMEARLFMANLLLALLLFLVFVICAGLASVVLISLFAVQLNGQLPSAASVTSDFVSKVLGPDAIPATWAIILLVLALVVIRLALHVPATADTKTVQLLKTWKLIRGRFWQLLATTLILWLPSMLIIASAGMALDGKMTSLEPGETFLFSLACGGWAGAAAMPLAAGVQAYFYRLQKTLK